MDAFNDYERVEVDEDELRGRLKKRAETERLTYEKMGGFQKKNQLSLKMIFYFSLKKNIICLHK